MSRRQGDRATVWEWQCEVDNAWREFDQHHSNILERSFNTPDCQSAVLVHGSCRYTVRFQSTGHGFQINNSDPNERCEVRRRNNTSHPDSTAANTTAEISAPAPPRLDRWMEDSEHASDVAPEVLYLHVATQLRNTEDSKHTVFHQASVTTDRAGEHLPESVKSVAYHTPGQGFKNDTRERHAAPFEIRYGPCWGRPHVTIDVRLKNGNLLRACFEDNFPAEDKCFLLHQPPESAPLETDSSGQEPRHQLQPDQVADHLVCSISCQVFQDPVVAMDGHTYERACIERWLLDHDTSPMTNLALPSKQVVPNLALRKELDSIASDPTIASSH